MAIKMTVHLFSGSVTFDSVEAALVLQSGVLKVVEDANGGVQTTHLYNPRLWSRVETMETF